MRYIAKPNTWFKAGTEAKLEEYLYEVPYMDLGNGKIQNATKSGLFRGIRVCENPASEGESLKVGEEYEKGEVCSYDEFDIVE